MSRTTIAIQTETRARIKAAAENESKTIDAFLQSLLDEHEQNQFWHSFADVTPDAYGATTSQDADTLDENYAVEDRTIASDER